MLGKIVLVLSVIALAALPSATRAQTSNLLAAPPLVDAVEENSLQRARDALARGANPNVPYIDGETVLMVAARNDNPAMIDLLLENDANPRMSDDEDNTALHWAARRASGDTLSLLIQGTLDAGGDLDSLNANGETPLVVAVRQDNAEAVRLLIDAGADVDVTDFTGRSARDWGAVSRSRTIRNLVEGADG